MIRILFALAFLFDVTLAQANIDEEIQSLLSQRQRPTMAEVEKLVEEFKFPSNIPVDANWISQNGYDSRIDIKAWTKILLDYAPHVIAKLEATYPDAVWVFLGRDGMAFADVLEAFYLSIGEKNRVIRFGVSKASMGTLTKKAVLANFKRLGYDIDSATKNKSPALIFVDTVSSGNGRQGRQILSTIYSYLLKGHKIDFKKLIRKINMVGLVVSTHGGGHLPVEDQSTYYSNYDQLIDSLPARIQSASQLAQQHTFMSIQQAQLDANESGYTHYIGAWHDSFGGVAKSKGNYEIAIGKQFAPEMKLSILWTQAEIWRAVKSESFLKSVNSERKKLNLRPITRGGCDDFLKKAS